MRPGRNHPRDIVFGLSCFCLLAVYFNDWSVLSLYFIILALAGFYYFYYSLKNRNKRDEEKDWAESGTVALAMALAMFILPTLLIIIMAFLISL